MIVRSVIGGLALSAVSFAAFAAVTYRPIEERWDDMKCPKTMMGGNATDSPTVITKNGDIINLHKAEWWEIWHRKNGMVTERIFHFGTCKPYYVYWHTFKPQTFVIPAHSSVRIPIAEFRFKQPR